MDTPLKYNEEYYKYLDDLRESGITNMFGAAAYLQDHFSLDKQLAKQSPIRLDEDLWGTA